LRTEFHPRITKPIRETLDTQGFAFPKPEPREKAQPKDGRRIESSHQYRITKQQIWARQAGMCGNLAKKCKNYMPTAAHGHRHHPGGRGLGGSKRDDSKTVLWCIPCHLEEHD
jgi:hypothetical protein